MKRKIHSRRGGAKVVLGVLAAIVVFLPGGARAIDLAFSSPTVMGDGSPGTTALFKNIGTQDGVDIDMLAEVIDATPGKIAYFSAIGGGRFRFDIGPNTGDRFFRVRYRFFESGTSTPRAIDAMSWSVGDLDETTSRIESLVVRGTSGYLAEKNTTLEISQSSYTISATGTMDLDEDDPDGNPEGVISFLFENRAVIEVTYSVVGGGGGYYDHDGVSEFPFYTPRITHMGIFYTFDIVNDEEVPVKMDFTNTLPADFAWDTEFEPVFDGLLGDVSDPGGVVTSMSDVLQFMDGGKTASFTEVTFPPGTTKFTLKTQSTKAVGPYTNEATVVQSANSNFPPVEMVSTSTILLPDPSPVPPEGPVGTLIEAFKLNFCSYALFQIGGTAGLSGGSTVSGDVAIADGALAGFSPEQVDGKVVNHNPNPAEESPTQTDLSDEVVAAFALNEDLAALPADQTFGTINGDTTITTTVPGGMNVIAVDVIKLSSDEQLVLKGRAKDWVIVNVASDIITSGSARIILKGLKPAHVLLNLGPGVSNASLTGSSGALGVSILAPWSEVKLSGSSEIVGSVISGTDTSLSGGATISGRAIFGGECD